MRAHILKIIVAIIRIFSIINIAVGSVAHLEERLHGMEEVASSILVGSTKTTKIPNPMDWGFILFPDDDSLIDIVSEVVFFFI